MILLGSDLMRTVSFPLLLQKLFQRPPPGQLRAINPENGFFGVAPGTSMASNPIAMGTIFRDTIFSNVALTEDGGVWWEGMTKQKPRRCTDWRGKPWTPTKCSTPAAHPNSRCPMSGIG